MHPLATRTTTALLAALHDVRDPAWEAFDDRYRPILYGFARSWHLPEADAMDVAQESLTQFARDYREGKYQREKGRLSSWLISIARNRIVDTQRSMKRRGLLSNETAMIDVATEDHLTREWTLSRERAILDQAMALLRSNSRTSDATMQAWELVAVKGVPASEAARQTGLSVDEVYVAKNRVTKRLRTIVEDLTAAWDDEP
ncbi:MAG: sigma-70 family RNA polymerase sigma factor [Phycisphaeraceae bacterium]|nr:sigma-70 family RNA polymerase sigma factor [Phycisphaerales bacterium]MCB9859213.1 sigma-70 family RNA polymerase sigma factor [Phycisphaeraceae bacterium]